MTNVLKLSSRLGALLGLGLLATSGMTQAALLTTAPASGTVVINFDNLTLENGPFNVSVPVQLGDAIGHDVTVVSSDPDNGLYFHYDGWGMADNGQWANRTYVGLNSHDDIMEFAFHDAPVATVGGQLGYARGCCGDVPLVITVLDANRAVLEIYNLSELADIVTPNAINGSAFRGIGRNVADIAFFQISGGEANALDDLTLAYTPSPVPLPGTLGMALGALTMLAGAARRRQRPAA